jgi:hypothetical protein
MASIAELQFQDRSDSHEFESVGSILRRALGELEERMMEPFSPTLSLEIDTVIQQIEEIDEQGKEGHASDNG